MQRPILMRALGARARQSLLHRYYRGRAKHWRNLYMRATLRYAPQIIMSDLSPGDVLSDSIAFTGSYEDDLSRHLIEIARRRGGLMVDVGANLGYLSLLWAAHGARNRVIAIEASPRVFPALKANVAANALGDRIEVINTATGRERGKLPFDLGPPDQNGWGGFAQSDGENRIEVEVVPLDTLLEREPMIELLKIDVEGAELWVLKGASQQLRRRTIREIWYEENNARMSALGIDKGAAARFLEGFGYRASLMSGARSGLEQWCARAPQ